MIQIPPKPEPKECTKPEPFHLESIVRHEEEQRRMAEERAKLEQMEASLKEFHAQPNLSR
jgi:targeting protein for Xklp2